MSIHAARSETPQKQRARHELLDLLEEPNFAVTLERMQRGNLMHVLHLIHQAGISDTQLSEFVEREYQALFPEGERHHARVTEEDIIDLRLKAAGDSKLGEALCAFINNDLKDEIARMESAAAHA